MMFIRCMVLKIETDRAVCLYCKIILLKLLVDEIRYVKQLYFRNDATYNIKTCKCLHIPNNVQILALKSALRTLHRKKMKYASCLIIERVRRLYIQQHPSVLKAAT